MNRALGFFSLSSLPQSSEFNKIRFSTTETTASAPSCSQQLARCSQRAGQFSTSTRSLPGRQLVGWGGSVVSRTEDGPEELLAGLDADALLLARLVRRRVFLGAFLFLAI
jgi:hypothetical protein